MRYEPVEFALFDQCRSIQQGFCQHVDPADMGMKQVLRIDRLAAGLGIEVEAAGGKSPTFENVAKRHRKLADIVGKLVRIPTILRVAPVHVDRAEYPKRIGSRNFVFETVSCQRRVIGFNFDLDLVFQPVPFEKAVDGRDVVIVLVLHRLVRLWLDQDRALEADLVLVFDHHRHEPAKLIELARDVGVEDRVVAFAPAPQHVIGSAQLMCRLDHRAHLKRGIGEHLRVGVCCRAGSVAAVAEQVCGAPQKAHTGIGHARFHLVDNEFQFVPIGAGAVMSGHRIDIVEAEEWRAHA